MKLKLLILAVILLGAPRAQAFESDMSPGEGIPSFRAKADLPLHQEPSAQSPVVAGVTVKKGTVVTGKEARFKTIKPGVVSVQAPVTVSGVSYGKVDRLTKEAYYAENLPEKNYPLKPGDSIEYLQDRAEGNRLVRLNGEILQIGFGEELKVTSSPVNEWWVKVSDQKGTGWLLIDKASVEFLERKM